MMKEFENFQILKEDITAMIKPRVVYKIDTILREGLKKINFLTIQGKKEGRVLTPPSKDLKRGPTSPLRV